MSNTEVAGPVLDGAVALLLVLLLAVSGLAARYRRECWQLRRRNTQLSAENDRWHEDFSAQAGELTVLRNLVPHQNAVIDISRAEVP